MAIRGRHTAPHDHTMLQAFANHLALALERSTLREEAMRVQLLEEIDHLRRSLVGAVSHDLRTPLATITVATSSLLDRNAPLGSADARELIRLIDVQSHRLDRLVANLLDMTRIQSGALELRRVSCGIGDIVGDALDTLGSAIDRTRVVWTPPEQLPPVMVDRVLICQVLSNLIDNALRYSPVGKPIEIMAELADGDCVVVSVVDHGSGLTADQQTSVFNMFNAREAGGRGGLGLAIAHAFIAAHGQRIWVAKATAGETCFAFTLPR